MSQHEPEAPGVEQPQPAAAEAPPPAEAEDELTKLRREVAELRDKQLRLLAEAQNLQKRSQREKEEALRYAEGDFARDLLVVLDDLDRAREAALGDADKAVVADGIRIVQEHFLKIFKQRGIEPIEAVGRPFDPSFHEALMQQPSDEQPAGTVLSEWARGYQMRARVLRPSRVVVSSGLATPPEQPAPPATEE